MRRPVIFVLLCTLNCSLVFGQAFLNTPITGVEGKDWIIVNYVDWDTTGFKDHKCGSKSYDGHQGTDFTIRSFRQMDSGVDVLAGANGRITFIKDGEFDRETEGTISKGLGNYVAIRHANGYYSYYGHLRKNSVNINVGDSVNSGDVIGQVGSSGNSTDPHLHFELWFDSLYVVDPFAGICGNPNSLWINSPVYDTSFGVFESGIVSQKDLAINDIRERPMLSLPYVFTPSSSNDLNCWAHMYGVKSGKEITINWYSPDGNLWFTYGYTLDRDYWYYFFWSFINHNNLPEGDWNVDVIYDGNVVLNQDFEINATGTVKDASWDNYCQDYKEMAIEELISDPQLDVTIYSSLGTEVGKSIMSPGLYYLHIKEANDICVLRRYLEVGY